MKILYKTNTEILSQVSSIRYNYNLPGLVKTIYNLILYVKLNRILCDEDKYQIDNLIWKDGVGINKGMAWVIPNIQDFLWGQKIIKEAQVNYEESARELDEVLIKLNGNKDDEWCEDNYIHGLTDQELENRNKPYPGGIHRIPDEIIYNQRIAESGTEEGVQWIIFNKVHGCWPAIVTSPHRIRANGTKGCVLFRDTNLKDLKFQLRINIIKENNLQQEFMGKRNKAPNIDRVREVMGINSDPNLDSDDIF